MILTKVSFFKFLQKRLLYKRLNQDLKDLNRDIKLI